MFTIFSRCWFTIYRHRQPIGMICEAVELHRIFELKYADRQTLKSALIKCEWQTRLLHLELTMGKMFREKGRKKTENGNGQFVCEREEYIAEGRFDITAAAGTTRSI